MQLEIVEEMLLEEAPSALFPFEKDILTYIVKDCFKISRQFIITKIKIKFYEYYGYMRQEQYVSKWTGKVFPANQNTIRHYKRLKLMDIMTYP